MIEALGNRNGKVRNEQALIAVADLFLAANASAGGSLDVVYRIANRRPP